MLKYAPIACFFIGLFSLIYTVHRSYEYLSQAVSKFDFIPLTFTFSFPFNLLPMLALILGVRSISKLKKGVLFAWLGIACAILSIISHYIMPQLYVFF